ncbi:uncharacterized protein LOC125772207 [Anopheles funestus]|uniref:uncharacterized protein LOC125772207 n=1 Tax=Anopheles funestus TaxID=62324 RepID=UPI0020C6B05B|nr:uncharacterized protein LOC125772207 [Anopheles funestus]
MAPGMNLIRSVGKKVIVEYGGHIYSMPKQDFEHGSHSDRQPRSYEKQEEFGPEQHHQNVSKHVGGVDHALSDTCSELSDLNLSNDYCTSKATNPVHPVVSSSAAKVLSELKEEVTRLIDESIHKIELEWVQNSKTVADATCEAVPPEATMDSIQCGEDTSRNLHPDGDRGQLTHREQNLQVLHTELFATSKRQTRMKLLNEIRELVERLKDMETLET